MLRVKQARRRRGGLGGSPSVIRAALSVFSVAGVLANVQEPKCHSLSGAYGYAKIVSFKHFWGIVLASFWHRVGFILALFWHDYGMVLAWCPYGVGISGASWWSDRLRNRRHSDNALAIL